MRTVTTDRGKVIVDKTAEIELGDLGYNSNDKRFDLCTLSNRESIQEHWEKILATISFSIDKDVAMVVVQDEAERLAEIEVEDKSFTNIAERTKAINMFIAGHEAAQEKGVYSEEDMYMLAGKVTDDIAKNKSNAAWCFFTTPKMIADEYIQSLNKDHVELEMEEVYFHGSGYYKKEELSLEKQTRYSFMKETRIKTTRNSSNQLIAYAK